MHPEIKSDPKRSGQQKICPRWSEHFWSDYALEARHSCLERSDFKRSVQSGLALGKKQSSKRAIWKVHLRCASHFGKSSLGLHESAF